MQDGVLDKGKKLLASLVEPHSSIQGIRKRQQSRLLSSFLLLAIPIFVYSQFTSDLLLFSTPVYLLGITLVFLGYLGTRTKYYDVTLAIALSGITVLPTIMFLFASSWSPYDLPRLMVWFLVALIAGALLSRTAVVLAQGIVMVSLMIFIVGVIFEVPLSQFDSHIGTAVVVTFFVLVASYTLEQYVRQVTQRTADLRRNQWELEVYTQLLRHDLRNDLQAILSSIELAEMFLDVSSEAVKENLVQSLSLSERMIRLLHVFSLPLDHPDTDLVKHIEDAANESEKIHGNLAIRIFAADEVSKHTFNASRLLPMVWQNIFRNAAQYAGDNPTVHVDISITDGMFMISFKDDGPGIQDDEKEWLFRRGSNSESGNRGQGLYLSRFVLEAHGGSIQLVDELDSTGTELLIRIPASSA